MNARSGNFPHLSSQLKTHNSKLRAGRIVALFLLAFSSLAAGFAPAFAQGKPRAQPDNPYGVNVFLHKEVEPWKIEQTLRMVAEANIQYVKQEFPWQEIEFRKGYFTDDKWQKSAWEKFDNIVDMADKYKLTVIARVDHAPDWAKAAAGGNSPLKDYKDLADFTNALLDHYKGRIKYVQLWNEPNLAGEWVPGKAVKPAEYAAMLKAVYPAIKAAHPDAVVLSAPMAMTLEGPESRGNMNEIDFWTQMYEAGAKGSFDVASANGYGLDQPPDAAPDPKVLNFRRVELLRDIMVKNGDSATPVWFDEYGWNASPETLSEAEKNYWRHVTPQQQAEWTVQGIEYARKNWPWAGVISIWYFRQVGDIPPDKAEYYFAMVDPDFKPYPVYDAVKTDAAKYPGPVAQGQTLPTPSNPSPTPAVTSAPAEPTGTTVPVQGTDTPAAGEATATPKGPAATASPATPVAGANTGAVVLYVIGGLLVVGGLAGLGYYFMKRPPAS